ncbi:MULTISPECIES: phage major tail tube protein [Burkholderia]|jgi:P2 family phage contractile tail tube protein|uniref:phage major tail tube protein n=1 Tax=Burkholderia TaxID=32008 RepID=UPI0001A4B256|nr:MULTISPECIES: phage major tail tube protein [Burkholderia]ACR27329.1 Phage major tail tube protein [Burkholderia glumae BGR1]MEB2546579.1 phage major tail tube protein [Burkholderia gladioli]UVT00417.1 phage major tail tube protein [Burkholderia glumae]
MGMPRKLKNFMLFYNGNRFAGDVDEIELPKLKRKMEGWQGGGMSGPVKIDMGQDEIQLEWTCGGLMTEVLSDWGITTHDGVLLRFAGGYQAEDSAKYDSVEIIVRGRHEEIDMGKAKVKDNTSFKVTTAASYYKLSVNGSVLIEIDFINMIENVNGTDLAAGLRNAIGL